MIDQLVLADGREFRLDENGYLLDWTEWVPDVARALAQADAIELQDGHWLVIEMLRSWYEEFEVAPPMRALVKAVRERLGEEFGNSRYLYRLFPEGPAKQACRYAGLPKPVSCI